MSPRRSAFWSAALATVRAALLAVAATLLLARPALGHDQPAGAEWLMADWMLLSFLAFGAIALVAFLVALKRGYLSNLEDAKYHILTIDEPDYYTPAWARADALEDDDAKR
jgi:hypothetical protein